MRIIAGVALLAAFVSAGAQPAAITEPDAGCLLTWKQADMEYADWHDREVADTSNFVKAVEDFERATRRCANTRLEAVSWEYLGNAAFSAADWKKAENAYCHIAKEGDEHMQFTCSLLIACKDDPFLNNLRRAQLHEMRGNVVGAAGLYRNVATSQCKELSAYAATKANLLTTFAKRPPL